jgi:hypothetical protein
MAGRVLSSLWLLALLSSAALAGPNTVVTLGTVDQIDGPNDLDLTGNIVYAVDNGIDGVGATVQGVAFTQNPLGYTTTGPGPTPGGWTSYAMSDGAPADNAALNSILTDIACCGTHSYDFVVTPGKNYKVQMLWGENGGSQPRIWDIMVEGAVTVDEVDSNGLIVGGVQPPSTGGLTATRYTFELAALDGVLDIDIGGSLLVGAGELGADRNYVLSAIIIEELVDIPEPSTIAIWALIGLVAAGFGFRRRWKS